MKNVKIGLLPLYLKLYDDTMRDRRTRVEAFYNEIAGEFEKRGIDVVTVPICRIVGEFRKAVREFEEKDVDAIVTLHMAYSPSLESAAVLAATGLPIIVCDTTPTFSYGPTQNPDELMYNHGIHGVQDMCNLLVQNGKPFQIEAGHWQKSDVIDRVSLHITAARMSSYMRTMRAGIIGAPFKGMGDFYVSPEDLRNSIGPDVVPLERDKLESCLKGVSDAQVESELTSDLDSMEVEVCEDVHRRSIRLYLALKQWVEEENLGAFSFNFLNVTRDEGFETVPFMAASKLMASGIGYAGEGDMLTASLVGAVLSGSRETSFTEMFCPDWENDSVYLSHMGEVNWNVLAGKGKLLEFDYPYSDTGNPAYIAGCFKPGEFNLINLAPVGGGDYRLIIVPATMLPVEGKDNMHRSVRGWFKTSFKLDEFLAEYSRYGGTHHSAMSYGISVETAVSFGQMMGWETVVIG